MNADDWTFLHTNHAHESKVNDLTKIYFKTCPQEFNYFAINEFEQLVSCSDDGKVKFFSIEETSKEVRSISDSDTPVNCLCTIKDEENKYDKLLLTGS